VLDEGLITFCDESVNVRKALISFPTAARAVAPATPTVAAADAGALRTIYRGPYSAAPCSRELVNGRSMLP
jgi:hypothetical protein